MNNRKPPSTLYLSLDGIMEPLGRSQVLKYLEKLSKNYQINLLTFEKDADLQNSDLLKETHDQCNRHNICWHKIRYRSGLKGFGQFCNVLNLLVMPAYIMARKKILLVHIRSYMPGIVIPFLSIFFKFKLIFDIRGFWPDEKHDRLNWSKTSSKYKFFKHLEKYLFKKADHIVTLTEESKKIISKKFFKPTSLIAVIPTCVDIMEFRSSGNFIKNLNKKASITIGYLGSVDTAYDFKKFMFLLKQIREYTNSKINLNLKIFTKKDPKYISNLLAENHVFGFNLDIRFVTRDRLPSEITKLDILTFCLKENFSIKASMPTKIAEVLACGKPILCNAFNKDIEKLINNNSIGLIYNFIDNFGITDYQKLISLIENEDTKKQCENVAKTYFSLNDGFAKYDKIYSQLAIK